MWLLPSLPLLLPLLLLPPLLQARILPCQHSLPHPWQQAASWPQLQPPPPLLPALQLSPLLGARFLLTLDSQPFLSGLLLLLLQQLVLLPLEPCLLPSQPLLLLPPPSRPRQRLAQKQQQAQAWQRHTLAVSPWWHRPHPAAAAAAVAP
jgi:hypothetical protein